MQYILSLLPLLACPLGMGLLVWFIMRGSKVQAPQMTEQAPMYAYHKPQEVAKSPQGKSMLSMLFMCLNWKVVVGLAVVGLLVGVVAPRFLLGAIPLLILAACPLSMLFMMGSMRGNHVASQPVQHSPSTAEEMTREEHIAMLKAQLASTQAQLETLSYETPEPEESQAPIIYEAESVARAGRKQSGSGSTPKW